MMNGEKQKKNRLFISKFSIKNLEFIFFIIYVYFENIVPFFFFTSVHNCLVVADELAGRSDVM